MVAKAEELVSRLKSSDASQRLKAVRDVKNQIIGNRPRKKAYLKLEVVPRIVELLADAPGTALQVQCATVVGSLARLDQRSALTVLEAGGFALLLRMTDSTDETVVESGLRALNFYLEAYFSDTQKQMDVGVHYLQRCTALLSSSNVAIKCQAATFISYCAYEPTLGQPLKEIGAVEELMALVSEPQPEVAAARAVAALHSLSEGGHVPLPWNLECVECLLSRMKACTTPRSQLHCCACITQMSAGQSGPEAKAARRRCLIQLARLVAEWEWSSDDVSPFGVLSSLLHLEVDLKQAARDSGIMHALAKRMRLSARPSDDPEIPLYRVVAFLIEDSEEGRKQLLEVGGEPLVQRILNGTCSLDRTARLASLDCMRALSRSAACLRQQQAAFRSCVAPCLAVLQPDKPVELQVVACQLLGNLLLSFSPARESAFSKGCIETLGGLIGSTEREVVSQALLALANAARQSQSKERKQIMAAIGDGSRIRELALSGMDPGLYVRAMVLMQNLTAGCQPEELLAFTSWSGLDALSPEGGKPNLLMPGHLMSQASKDLQSAGLTAAINITYNMIIGMTLPNQLQPATLRMLAKTFGELLGHASKDVVTSALRVLRSLVSSQLPGSEDRIKLLGEERIFDLVETLSQNHAKLDVREGATMLLEASGRIAAEPMSQEEYQPLAQEDTPMSDSV